MLIASLVLSGVLLVAVNVTAFRSRSILRTVPWCGLGLTGLGFCMIFLPALLLHAALTLVAGLVCAWLAPRPRVFLATTIGAFLIAYGVIGVPTWLELNQLTQEHGPISVADRLNYEWTPSKLPTAPVLGADVHLIALRGAAKSPFEESENSTPRSRVGALKHLHDHQVSVFVNSPGFGVMRGPGPVTGWLALPEEEPVPFELPDSFVPPESRGLVGGEASLDDSTSGILRDLHRSSVNDFVFADGFGYVKNRNQVFGFRPHRFSKAPSQTDFMSSWRFRKLELVSLLKHGKPAVYLSEHLPRMSELRHAQTRPLDAFEAAALPRLANDYLVIHATDERLRVLGSLRAGEKCLECHTGQKGDLLGAFSYTLDRPAAK